MTKTKIRPQQYYKYVFTYVQHYNSMIVATYYTLFCFNTNRTVPVPNHTKHFFRTRY